MSGTLDVIETGKPYINREYLAPEPPPSAEYRQGEDGHNCGQCLYFEEGACAVYNARVEADHVCNAYESDDSMNEDEYTLTGAFSAMGELYFDDGNTSESDGQIVKTVLRTGTWAYSPDRNQLPIPSPLRVISGHSSNPQEEIGLADIVGAFKDGAIEHVTVPLSHEDRVHENTGFVKDLFIDSDPDNIGEHRLRAVFNFTDPSIAEKVNNGSIANTSAGLLFNYIRKDDGKKFGIALAHVALTNHPWINGMEPFGIAASESEKVVSLQFAASAPAKPAAPAKQSAKVIWQGDSSYRYLEGAIHDALCKLSPVSDEMGCPYGVVDIATDKALITNYEAGGTFVVPFSVDNSGDAGLTLAPTDKWIKAEQEWVKASEKLTEEIKNIKNFSVETPADQKSEKPKAAGKPVNLSVQDELQGSQRRRELRLSQSTNGKRTGGNSMSDVLKDLELAEDVRAQLEDALNAREEVKNLRSQARQRQVEDRVEELKELGFSEYPGLLAYTRQVLLSDDEGTALLLSEDGEAGKKDTKLSAAEIIDGFIERLPQSDGKINFGEQATNLGGNDGRPATDTKDENDTAALSSRIDETREWLYGSKE